VALDDPGEAAEIIMLAPWLGPGLSARFTSGHDEIALSELLADAGAAKLTIAKQKSEEHQTTAGRDVERLVQ
jgi:hypothetical protein